MQNLKKLMWLITNYTSGGLWHNRWLGADWERKFSFRPRFCSLTGKLIWLSWAYRARILINGPGKPIQLVEWHHKNPHIIWLLKNA